jgi:hypothetical protein
LKTRKTAIFERTGQLAFTGETVDKARAYVKNEMNTEGFDKVMMAAIVGRDYLTDSGLFLAHMEDIRDID